MGRQGWVLADIRAKFAEKEVSPSYLRLYQGVDFELDRIFAYFHQKLNNLFEFINNKIEVNRHFNAHESRELLSLNRELQETISDLKYANISVELSEDYKEILRKCGTFLERSGGSSIPNDFPPIQVERYLPVFEFTDTRIKLSNKHVQYPLQMVGAGAFADVYKYKDEDYGKFFAVKKAKKSISERDLARFRREYEILKSLSSPYILEVYSYDGERNHYTMEYCDITLERYIRDNNSKLTSGARKRLALQFLYAITYIHRKEILHRDISYRNILVKRFDLDVVLIKLSDFGLAKEETSDFTKTDSELKGTIVDPTLKSLKDYSRVNEMYPIGFVLNFILTGKSTLHISNKNPIHRLFQCCTDLDVTRRYASIKDIISDVEQLIP